MLGVHDIVKPKTSAPGEGRSLALLECTVFTEGLARQPH